MLIESLHTQANEPLNNSLSYFAPKNVNHVRSSSLINRVAINRGIQINGYLRFFSNVYSSVSIDLSDSFHAYLQRKDENKEFMKDKRKTIVYKRKQKYANNSKIMEDIVEAKASKQNNLRLTNLK